MKTRGKSNGKAKSPVPESSFGGVICFLVSWGGERVGGGPSYRMLTGNSPNPYASLANVVDFAGCYEPGWPPPQGLDKPHLISTSPSPRENGCSRTQPPPKNHPSPKPGSLNCPKPQNAATSTGRDGLWKLGLLPKPPPRFCWKVHISF